MKKSVDMPFPVVCLYVEKNGFHGLHGFMAFSSLLVIIADPGTRWAGMEDLFVRTLKSFQNIFGSAS